MCIRDSSGIKRSRRVPREPFKSMTASGARRWDMAGQRSGASAAVMIRASFGAAAVKARSNSPTPALPMRSAWVEIGRFTVINDAYNANPASARESLRMLAALDTTRQRVAILGSMLELGAACPRLHDEIANIALRGPA